MSTTNPLCPRQRLLVVERVLHALLDSLLPALLALMLVLLPPLAGQPLLERVDLVVGHAIGVVLRDRQARRLRAAAHVFVALAPVRRSAAGGRRSLGLVLVLLAIVVIVVVFLLVVVIVVPSEARGLVRRRSRREPLRLKLRLQRLPVGPQLESTERAALAHIVAGKALVVSLEGRLLARNQLRSEPRQRDRQDCRRREFVDSHGC
mmetsp:Transcript_104486/g.302339  ORF Transcript_104486/g.302339 Transcript_104486/m.302339 type:complete len:206 (-) Transcript_104486:61-678(-)